MLGGDAAYLSGFLVLWATGMYVRDIYRGTVRPNLVTWFLWCLAPMIAFFAQISDGVGKEAILTFAVGFGPLVVFVAGIKRGKFRPTLFDWCCGGASLIALVLWLLAGNGAVGVMLSIAADSLAAAPTIVKTFRNPRSESPFAFALFALAALATLLSVTEWSLTASGFSLYIFALYVLLFSLARFKSRKAPRQLYFEPSD